MPRRQCWGSKLVESILMRVVRLPLCVGKFQQGAHAMSACYQSQLSSEVVHQVLMYSCDCTDFWIVGEAVSRVVFSSFD